MLIEIFVNQLLSVLMFAKVQASLVFSQGQKNDYNISPCLAR